MCKTYIIIVVHQIQGHRIYSESIGRAKETRRPAPRSQARVVTEIWFLYSTAYRTPYLYRSGLGGKDTVTACCTMLSPALSVLFGQTAKKRPEGLKISTSPGQNNCPWSLTQSFWMAGKEKRTLTFPKCQSSSTRWNLR